MSYPVFIVDDNKVTAKLLGKLLNFAGYQASVANSGKEALEELAFSKPKVAILDINMPEMDGYEVARRIRSDKRLANIILVALTCYSQPEDKIKARESGFDHHIKKPATLDDIRRILNIYETRFEKDIL